MQKEINNLAEPLEYIRGFTEFLGCKIDLSKRPLVPRVETEYWVEKAIKQISFIPFIDGRQKYGIRVLDIFCGSGCIGLAVVSRLLRDPAMAGKNVEVTFADKYKYFNHPKFVKSDIFLNIPSKYDYIFANPPYVAESLKHKVQKSVLVYEPKVALFAGRDGMDIIKKFLKQAKSHLNKGGVIFMEFSPEQKSAVGDLTKKFGYKKCEFFKDQYNRYRWVEIV